jgi:lipopolysaccharide transport system permease protein
MHGGHASEAVYTADSQLRSPGSFVSGGASDLRVSPPVAWQLFLRRLQAEYRRSLLGYVWILLPPVAMTGAWMVLNATRVLTAGPTDIPYPLFALAGTTLWQVFVDAVHAPLHRLTAARAVLGKSRLPHEAFLLAGVLDVLFNFAVRVLVIVPVLVWYGAGPAPSLLLAPFGVAALLLLGFSVGLLLAPLGLLYSDVSRGITLVTGVLFFLTPVVYPVPPTGAAAWLLVANPIAPLLETARAWMTGGAALPADGFVPVVAASLGAFVLGWCCYRLARPHLVARL